MYIVPQYLSALSHPQLLHVIASLLVAVIVVIAAYKLASGAIYILLVALSAPLTYQLLGVLWQLSPPEKWDQVKLLISLFSGMFVSAFLIQHLELTSKIASVVLGALLIATSVQYLFDDGTYQSGIEKCLGSPEEGWDASECTPFYTCWLSAIMITLAWSILSSLSGGRPIGYWVTPQISPEMAERTESPYVRLEAIEERQEQPGMWESMKNIGKKSKRFLSEKFTNIQEDTQPGRLPRESSIGYERVP